MVEPKIEEQNYKLLTNTYKLKNMLLFNICTLPWWLPWLLLPLLGLLLGWLLWGKFQKMVADLEAEISRLKAKISGLESDLAECGHRRAGLDSEVSMLKGQLKEAQSSAKVTTQQAFVAPVASAPLSIAADMPAPSAGKKNIYGGLKSDNLQVVEGIGPKMDEVLKKYGVSTWKELSESTPESLRKILDEENPTQYRIIDPATWPAQARLAHSGQWEELISMQKKLDTGRANVGDGETDSKVEKLLIKMGVIKKWAQDDLKAVEGIGPKIESLLHNAGVKTWRELSLTPVDKIQAVLDAAGSRYKLADPGTWPKQAEMAADGRWDDLREYQDFLQGGK
jgi:predicted flap endonuclease-1-like 5' DNA nuclease